MELTNHIDNGEQRRPVDWTSIDGKSSCYTLIICKRQVEPKYILQIVCILRAIPKLPQWS